MFPNFYLCSTVADIKTDNTKYNILTWHGVQKKFSSFLQHDWVRILMKTFWNAWAYANHKLITVQFQYLACLPYNSKRKSLNLGLAVKPFKIKQASILLHQSSISIPKNICRLMKQVFWIIFRRRRLLGCGIKSNQPGERFEDVFLCCLYYVSFWSKNTIGSFDWYLCKGSERHHG